MVIIPFTEVETGSEGCSHLPCSSGLEGKVPLGLGSEAALTWGWLQVPAVPLWGGRRLC